MVFLAFNDWMVKYAVLSFFALEYVWEQYLAYRQYKKVSACVEPPAELKGTMPKDTFQKARLYSLAKYKFGFVKDAVDIIVSVSVVHCQILASIWHYSKSLNTFGGEVMTDCIWIFFLTTLSTFVHLPLTIYNTFILEEKFGFNKQTHAFFIWDQIKSFILAQVLTMMVSSVIIVTIKNGGDYFFIWLWLVVCIITLILVTIYPSLIAPLFDKFSPLPQGELRTQIESLASELKFPLKGLYIVEGSKRSSHSNAYFYGFFKSKRIVLFDTLLPKDESGSGCTNEEILAILSHELGHWYHNHMFKNVVISQVNLFLLFATFSAMFKYQPIYEAFGFYNIQPILPGLIVVIQYLMLPYNTVLNFLMTCLSRRFEFQADAFADRLGRSKYLTTALIQINKDNLGFPINDYYYSSWHHSHPPILERIEALKGKKE